MPAFYFRKLSPDGATTNWGNRHLITAYYSSIDPEEMKGWVGLVGLTYSGRFTHISGHPPATGRSKDRESSLARDRRSTSEPRNRPENVIENILKQTTNERAGQPWSPSRGDLGLWLEDYGGNNLWKMCFESGMKARKGDRRWQWWHWWKLWSGMIREVRLWSKDWIWSSRNDSGSSIQS